MARRDPRDTETALRRFAAEQGAYFTANQALRHGYTYRQQHFHRQRGTWEAVARGLFRFADQPLDRDDDLIRWTLWTRDRRDRVRGVVSHESALRVHELSDVDPARIHLTVPPSFRPRPPEGLRLHRATLGPRDVERRFGYRVTTPLRTLVDAANSRLSEELLEQAVRQAIDRGIVDVEELKGSDLSETGRSLLLSVLPARPAR